MSRDSVNALLDRVIDFWNDHHAGDPLDLHLAGGAAVLAHHGGRLATKDVDILVTSARRAELMKKLGDFIEGGSKIGAGELYIDLVLDAFACMPRCFQSRAILDRNVGSVRVFKLHPIDLVLSKIKRFAPKDRRDIETVLTREAVEPADLRRVFAEEQFTFEPDRAEKCSPRLTRIVAYLDGDVDDLG